MREEVLFPVDQQCPAGEAAAGAEAVVGEGAALKVSVVENRKAAGAMTRKPLVWTKSMPFISSGTRSAAYRETIAVLSI